MAARSFPSFVLWRLRAMANGPISPAKIKAAAKNIGRHNFTREKSYWPKKAQLEALRTAIQLYHSLQSEGTRPSNRPPPPFFSF
jgi:hypothetical protein